MNVFLGWSGEASHKLGQMFHDWLPLVIQRAKPYISSEDIAKGDRWFADIEANLAETHFGIIFITEENLDSPWIYYEAGYMANKMSKASLCPFLFGVEETKLSGSPLLQFQYVDAKRDDILRMIKSINDKLDQPDRLNETVLTRTFDSFWQPLADQLGQLKAQNQVGTVPEVEIGVPKTDAILSELLDLVRRQDRLLSDPRQLFSKDFIDMLVAKRDSGLDSKMTEALEIAAGAIKDQHLKLYKLVSGFRETYSNMEAKPFDEIMQSLQISAVTIQFLLSAVSKTDYKPPINDILNQTLYGRSDRY